MPIHFIFPSQIISSYFVYLYLNIYKVGKCELNYQSNVLKVYKNILKSRNFVKICEKNNANQVMQFSKNNNAILH